MQANRYSYQRFVSEDNGLSFDGIGRIRGGAWEGVHSERREDDINGVCDDGALSEYLGGRDGWT